VSSKQKFEELEKFVKELDEATAELLESAQEAIDGIDNDLDALEERANDQSIIIVELQGMADASAVAQRGMREDLRDLCSLAQRADIVAAEAADRNFAKLKTRIDFASRDIFDLRIAVGALQDEVAELKLSRWERIERWTKNLYYRWFA
jgi:DNA repair exonuclease SbcCD ATPase subunit